MARLHKYIAQNEYTPVSVRIAAICRNPCAAGAGPADYLRTSRCCKMTPSTSPEKLSCTSHLHSIISVSLILVPESYRHKDKMAFKRSLIASIFAATACTALQEIPPLGLGTWLSDREKVPHAVEYGLQNGYDHIDAAWIYRTFTSIFPLGILGYVVWQLT